MLRGGLGLVEALQSAVVAFVQAPVLQRGDPQQAHLIQDQVQGLVGPFEHAGEPEIKGESVVEEQTPGRPRLLHAFLGQGHVGPSGEAVFGVPLAFPVAYQHDLEHKGPSGLKWCGEMEASIAPRGLDFKLTWKR